MMARRHGGFAVITALLFMAVLAALLAGMTYHTGSQIRRDQRAWADAQLRELLLAAEPSARRLLAPGAPRSIQLAVPGALDGTCSCTRESAGRIAVQVRIGGRSMSEHLGYRQTSAGWELVEAVLE